MKVNGVVERALLAAFGRLTMPQFSRVVRVSIIGSALALVVVAAGFISGWDWGLALLGAWCVVMVVGIERSWSDDEANMRIAKRWSEEDGTDEFGTMVMLSVLDKFPLRDCHAFFRWTASLDGEDPWVAAERAPESVRRIMAATEPPAEPHWWDR